MRAGGGSAPIGPISDTAGSSSTVSVSGNDPEASPGTVCVAYTVSPALRRRVSVHFVGPRRRARDPFWLGLMDSMLASGASVRFA